MMEAVLVVGMILASVGFVLAVTAQTFSQRERSLIVKALSVLHQNGDMDADENQEIEELIEKLETNT